MNECIAYLIEELLPERKPFVNSAGAGHKGRIGSRCSRRSSRAIVAAVAAAR